MVLGPARIPSLRRSRSPLRPLRPRKARWIARLAVCAAVVTVLVGCDSTPFANSDDDSPLLVDLARNLAGPTPQQAAREAFDREDPDKRRRAIALLSSAEWGGEPAYLSVYRLILSDPDPTVRAACASALGRHGTPDDALLVANLLADDHAPLRWEAAKALRALHQPLVTPKLIDGLLRDENADVRMAAAEALGQYPRRDVFDALVTSLTDSEFGVAHAARRSLTTLTGADLGPEPADWHQLANQKSAEGNTALFTNARPYTYRQYVKPPGLFEKARFWEDPEAEANQQPAGLEDERES